MHRPADKYVIGARWLYKNKEYENCVIVRNKFRMVAQGYPEIEGIDFDETFAIIAHLKYVKMLIRLSCYFTIKLYQMNVKNVFLNYVMKRKCTLNNLKNLRTLTFLTMCCD